MLRVPIISLAGFVSFVNILSCGPSQEELTLAQLQVDLSLANATIDSLNYTVDSSNLLLDKMRAQVDSSDKVSAQLLESVQKLNREVNYWRDLTTKYRQNNEKLTAEIERLKVEKQADRQAIARGRSQADSLGNALLEAHTSIRRRSDHIRNMEADKVKAQDEAELLRQGQNTVHLYIGTESDLRESGHLAVSRLFSGGGRKSLRLIKRLDLSDPNVKRVSRDVTLSVGAELDALVDRFGKLRRGDSYQVHEEAGALRITFLDEMLKGADVVAVIKKQSGRR